MRIEPAALAFDSEGTPYSPAYCDVYHSADSGPGQAHHVFVGGNDLPCRWAGARVFTILETGFGLGLNFLATWREWRADPARCERLHFVSIEKHPFDRAALRTLHLRYPEFAPLAEQLQDAWPPLVPGLQRLHFEGERLTLTLAFGDVALVLPRLRLRADAIYLDGFAPRCNPEMWSAQLMRGLARLARPGTSVATYSSAGVVRQGLEAAGFALEKCPGFGHKREMLRGRFAPRWPPRRAPEAAPALASRHRHRSRSRRGGSQRAPGAARLAD
jgi:tRNA 5-methylaminomethyl-2-thiouridine biosynthesis bifunctional protein